MVNLKVKKKNDSVLVKWVIPIIHPNPSTSGNREEYPVCARHGARK